MHVSGRLRQSRAVALRACGGVALLAVVLVIVIHIRAAGGPRLLWADEFSGSAGSLPSTAHWQMQLGYFGKPYSSLECMTNDRSNSALDGHGNLKITAQKRSTPCGDAGTKPYSSARLTSHGLHSMKYGYLEFRAKMAGGSGTWNALWLLGSNYSDVGWPRCGEIDVAEVTSRNPTVSYSTVHEPGRGKGPSSVVGSRYSSSLSTAYHDYGMQWTPNTLRLTFDGYVYRTITRTEVERTGTWVFDHDFDVIMNLTVGGDWPKSPSATARFPQTLTVDYVRVYSGVPGTD